jgi:protoheme IX farnesyltransferase
VTRIRRLPRALARALSKPETFRRLALATAIATVAVIAAGATVRATGSGLGCPEWPKCFGRWIPPLTYHAIIEYTHRLVGAIDIVLLTLLTVVAVIWHRKRRAVYLATGLAWATILVQAGLGAKVVNSGNSPTLVTFHIATATALLGLLAYIAARSFLDARADASAGAVDVPAVVRRLATASAASVFGLILLGAYVRGEGAGLAFADWPLMNGRLIPALDSSPAAANFTHRVAAVLVGLVVAAFAVAATRARPRQKAVTAFAHAAMALFLVQAVVGGLQVLTKLDAVPVVLHVVLSSLTWAALIAAVTIARRAGAAQTAPESAALPGGGARRPEPAPISGGATPILTEAAAAQPLDAAASRGTPAAAPETAAPETPARLADILRAYLALTKPRIITLLLVTTVPSMVLAARAWPSTWLVLATLGGGTLGAGAANTINMFFDRDIDAVMRRTRSRPLPAHRVEPKRALIFGIVLAVISFVFMVAAISLLAALLTQAAIAFYVFVYTLGLKRTTPQNIVIGGAAGAVPALVGWAAVTGHVGLPAAVLFAIVFFWTPPHFWALAMRHTRDYADAGVPMLPVVAGDRATRRQILVYSVITVATSAALWPVADMGAIYVASAAALGAWLLVHAVRLLRSRDARAPMAMFRFSITYLALLFAAVGVDAVFHVAG